jgi:hypothetical protein
VSLNLRDRLFFNKLRDMYGIVDVALDWLRCYLSNRSYRVSFNEGSSGECLLEIGIPQGSILGPLLSKLYTRDLETIVTKFDSSILLFAEDILCF